MFQSTMSSVLLLYGLCFKKMKNLCNSSHLSFLKVDYLTVIVSKAYNLTLI
jgi:hypothetical protein